MEEGGGVSLGSPRDFSAKGHFCHVAEIQKLFRKYDLFSIYNFFYNNSYSYNLISIVVPLVFILFRQIEFA